MNGGYKISILFFLILMMIALPLALSFLPGQASTPQALTSEPVKTINDYQKRMNLALSATADAANESMKRVILGAAVNAGPRRPG